MYSLNNRTLTKTNSLLGLVDNLVLQVACETAPSIIFYRPKELFKQGLGNLNHCLFEMHTLKLKSLKIH